jgi:SAM-dependent methyltransferase
MGIGSTVRRLSGPFEPALTRAYRNAFFDIDSFADEIAALPDVQTVVEIGCGEGALLSALSRRLSSASLIGVDITAAVGRQYDGDRALVRFEQRPAASLADELGPVADVVILCDVMHHVPLDMRAGVWRAAEALVKPGGRIVFKEWVQRSTPIYWLGWASDRFITGDRIAYQSRAEWLVAMSVQMPEWRVESEAVLRPWRTNHAFILRRVALS